MHISLIVAVSENGVIGNNQDLIWHLPRDLRFFKQMTMGKTLLMGRKTFESIGKPLPGRNFKVVSRSTGDVGFKEVSVYPSIEAAISAARAEDVGELMIAGGGEIYRQALENNLVETAYVTLVHANFEGDTFFPKLPKEEWELINKVHFDPDEKNKYGVCFKTLRKS